MSNKRKRDDSGEPPTHARITYHACGMVVKLKQMRSNALLDLDDDDDFEALRVQALRDAHSTIDIKVTVEEDQSKVSTVPVDRPQQSVPAPSHDAEPVAVHRTARDKEPSEEPKSKAKGKKGNPPPKDVQLAASSTQEIPAQPETEANRVSVVIKSSVKGKHANEPPKKKHKHTKENVVFASSEPATAGESSKSIEGLKDNEASMSGEAPPSTDNIREQVSVAEGPSDDHSTEAVPSTDTKKSKQPRKSKSRLSLKSRDADGGEEGPPKSIKPKGSQQLTDKGAKSKVTKKCGVYEVSEPSLAEGRQSAAPATGSPENDPSKSDHDGTAPYSASKKALKKTSGGGPRVDTPEKRGNGGGSTAVDESRVSNTSLSNPSLLDAEAWSELLQKLKDDVAELQNQEGSISASCETKKKVAAKKSRRSIASLSTNSSSKHTPTPPTDLSLTEAPFLATHHDSISAAHAPCKSLSSGSHCLVCLQKPFHAIHHCPILLKGPHVIQQRLDELKQSDLRDSQNLIGELEALVRRHKGGDTVTTAHSSLPDEATCGTDAHSPPAASSSSQSLALNAIPGGPHLVDAVGSSNEESTAESSEEDGERVARTTYPLKPPLTRPSASYGDDMLEAVVRGPAPRRVLSNILKELQEEETQQVHLIEECGRRANRRFQQGSVPSSTDEDEEPPGSSPAISNRGRSSHSVTSRLGPTTRTLRGKPSLESKDTQAVPRTDPNWDKTGAASGNHTELHDDTKSSNSGPELPYPSDTYFPGIHPTEPDAPCPQTVDGFDIVSQSTPKFSMKRDKPSMVAGLSTSQKAAGKPKVLNLEPLPSAFAPKVTNPRGNKESKRSTKIVEKTPVTKPSAKGTTSGVTTNGHSAPTPSLVTWETMREPTPSVQCDELVSSSPQVEEHISLATKTDRLNGGRKERLFDLTPSQIPFPYSQYTPPQVSAPQSSEIDQNSVKEPPPKRPPQKNRFYRSLTALASEASSLFPSSLPTPRVATADGKAPREGTEDDTSNDDDDDDSSSSETDDPMASSILPNKKKRGLLHGL
ncbi:hypothetical protein F5J12DRAFT_797038 [Pisolithus orientalis]|uniref:uncharacterized protein n=1 Tax=Pisolithus orientalis TaxID=936130 RepID=UPI00222541B8|nr:uncharacterized protein F5J12DRAFT_797038 [Pisolithus orientalis]KAI6032880.1 hypothetical protein F5J12DRAFT_797038 [Pisolithus orientalis]